MPDSSSSIDFQCCMGITPATTNKRGLDGCDRGHLRRAPYVVGGLVQLREKCRWWTVTNKENCHFFIVRKPMGSFALRYCLLFLTMTARSA